MDDGPRSLAVDTAPEAAAVRLRLLAKLSPAEKLARVAELTEAAARWSLAGLAERHPGATQSELLLRLAVLRLGPDLVRRAYGWPSPMAGDDA
jgi:hypothetical protein